MANRRRISIAVLGLATAGLLSGCPLDQRTLYPSGGGGSFGIVGSDGGAGQGGMGPGATGSGGANAPAGGSGAGTGGGTASGSGGATDGGRDSGVDGPADMGGDGAIARESCVYSGTLVAPGCETLVSNPGFQSTVAGWEAEQVEVAAVWHASDAQGLQTSGSLAVTNRVYANADGSGMAGARRCIPITGGLTYDFAAGLFIPAGQGPGSGSIVVFFHETTDCSGDVKKSIVSLGESTADAWKVIELRDIAPATAKSMLVRLVALKPFRQGSLTVRFDNVLAQGNSK